LSGSGKGCNAIDLATSKELASAFDELDARDDLMVGMLTGTGSVFCAGMDLKAFLRGETAHGIRTEAQAGVARSLNCVTPQSV